ncbi:MAG: hypothetical protein ABI678_24650 [Kofleriaceae bacterium]
MKLAAFALAATLLGHAHVAGAFSACAGDSGWTADGATVPPHARIVFWRNQPGSNAPTTPIAKIDGKVVPTKVTTLDSAPNKLTIIEIDSNATGVLAIGWKDQDYRGSATYTVAKPAYPKVAHATTSRYHSKLSHTTVREVFDGLAIKVDVPAATRAHVKLRRDRKASWLALDAPVEKGGTIRIGELGCASNYQPDLLEKGVDIEVTLVLPDNTSIPVENFTHASIPKLGKPTSNNPSDAE